MNRFLLRQIYFYVVSLVTLFIVLWAIIGLGQHIVNLALPEPVVQPTPIQAPDGTTQPSGATLPDNYFRIQELRGIINSSITIVVALPLYLYHWRLARKTDKEPSESRQ